MMKIGCEVTSKFWVISGRDKWADGHGATSNCDDQFLVAQSVPVCGRHDKAERRLNLSDAYDSLSA